MNKIKNIPQGYKATSLGIIPQEWEISTLNNACNFLDSQRIPIKDSDRIKEPGIYPYYGASGIIDYINKYIFDDELILLAEDGANIINRSTPIAFLVNGKIWVNNHAHVLKVKSQFDRYYLCAYLESLRYDKYNTGTAQPKLNKDICKKIPVLMPPLSEQRKIAQILELWDKAIEKQSRLIEKLELRKKGLMQQFFTESKRSSRFDHIWEKVKLEEIAIFLNSNSLSREQLNNKKGKILNIHYGDILVKYPSILNVSKEDIPFINEDIEYTPKDYVNDGDIIMADTAEDEMVGRCCEIINIDDTKVVSGLHTILIHPIRTFASGYLGYYLNSEKYHKQIVSKMQGMKVYSITKDALKQTTIEIPCIEEQRIIANVLSRCDTEILLAKQKLYSFQQQKKGLMQILLTGKKRVI